MAWKQIQKAKDLICFEKSTGKLKIRIEARLEKKIWKIYKTYFDGKDLRMVEEFVANSEKRLNELLTKLKIERDYPRSMIKKIIDQQNNEITISLKRAYKEYEFEKWFFGINDDDKENVIVLHFGESIDMDIILNEKYRHIFKSILKALNKSLGMEDINKTMNIYYFNHQFEKMEKFQGPEYLMGKIELDLGYENETS